MNPPSARSGYGEAGPDRHRRRARFDVQRVREDFPILRQLVHGRPLIYFDNAATTQKPQVVLDAMVALLHRHQRQRSPGRSQPERAGDDGV